jgi:hypothetical protein
MDRKANKQTRLGKNFSQWCQFGAVLCVLYGWSLGARLYAQDATTLPEGKQESPYEFRFEADGAVGATIWRVIKGELPPGLILDDSGLLHGVPAGAKDEAYRFVVEVTDSARAPRKFSQTFALLIQPAPLRIKTPSGQQAALRIRTAAQEAVSGPAVVTQPDATLASLDNARLGVGGDSAGNGNLVEHIYPNASDTLRLSRIELRFLVKDPELQTYSLVVKGKDGKDIVLIKDQALELIKDVARTIAVTLQPGKNEITLTVSGKNGKKDTLTWELTYKPADEIHLVNLPAEGDTEVFGKDAMPDAEIKVIRGNAELTDTIRANGKGQFFWNPPANQPLAAGERLSFKQKGARETEFSHASDFISVASIEQKDDLRAGSPQGYIFGGLVLSQQAQEFKQADPFIGFEAGYRFGAFRKKTRYGMVVSPDGRPLDREGYILRPAKVDGNGRCDGADCHVIERIDCSSRKSDCGKKWICSTRNSSSKTCSATAIMRRSKDWPRA